MTAPLPESRTTTAGVTDEPTEAPPGALEANGSAAAPAVEDADADAPAAPAEAAGGLPWTQRHLLDLDVVPPAEIESVLLLADRMLEVLERRIARVPTLRGFTIFTLFYEASTRTRASFELAGKVLGADVVNVSPQSASVQKGESLVDTVRTLSAMEADAIVMRHASAGAPYLAARHSSASIVNAGDGAHAHPTQALLDLYTIRRELGSIAGRRVVMIGDIAHSRVARSDIWGLTAMGAEVVICGPPTLLPRGLRPGERTAAAAEALPNVRVETDIERAIEGADVVMALRLQSERQQGGLLPSLREYARLYQVTAERFALAKPHALLMHPGPKNEGIEIAADVATGDHSIIEQQVTNGVAVRMALLYLLSGRVDPALLEERS
jgi:aspartate carbamoyltransferase catalytic subunit